MKSVDFDIPLLEAHKTHKRMSSPSLWMYSKQYLEESGKILEISTAVGSFKFLYTTASQIISHWEKGPNPEGYGLDEELANQANWVAEGGYSKGYGALSANNRLQWVGLPTGDWGVCADTTRGAPLLHLIRCSDVDLSRKMYGRLDDGDEAGRAKVLEVDEALSCIFQDFESKWKKSRRAWKRQQRESGALEAHKEQKAKDDAAELHSAKIAATEHITHLIGLLSKQITNIQRDEVTVEGVREIFDATNELTAKHARLKKAYKLQ